MSRRAMEMFEELVERWLEEFSRAVEMFTGEKPELSLVAGAGETTAEEIAGRTWWKQPVEGGDPFSFWAGTTESIWNTLGEGDEARTSLFEMLSQANQGTVAVLSASFASPLNCREGTIEAPASSPETLVANIKIQFRGAEAGQLLFLVEKKAVAVLGLEAKESVSTASGDLLPAFGAGSSMLARLMDLQLPVSVLLGRATITIRDAVKLMPGSIIELDKRVGDHVEVIVHGTVVARGEIVAVRGNYGVRIKEVISRQDRMALREAA